MNERITIIDNDYDDIYVQWIRHKIYFGLCEAIDTFEKFINYYVTWEKMKK